MKLVPQIVLVAVAGSALGFAANALSPKPAPIGAPVRPASEETGTCDVAAAADPTGAVPRIAVAQAAPLCADCKAAFVDARTEEAFQAGHVSGAIHLPPGDVPPAAMDHLKQFGTVVVYDDQPEGILAEAVAMGLRELGVRDVRVLTGAWPAWTAAGAPGASGPCGTCNTKGAQP